jgi:hypothetical protein
MLDPLPADCSPPWSWVDVLWVDWLHVEHTRRCSMGQRRRGVAPHSRHHGSGTRLTPWRHGTRSCVATGYASPVASASAVATSRPRAASSVWGAADGCGSIGSADLASRRPSRSRNRRDGRPVPAGRIGRPGECRPPRSIRAGPQAAPRCCLEASAAAPCMRVQPGAAPHRPPASEAGSCSASVNACSIDNRSASCAWRSSHHA